MSLTQAKHYQAWLVDYALTCTPQTKLTDSFYISFALKNIFPSWE